MLKSHLAKWRRAFRMRSGYGMLLAVFFLGSAFPQNSFSAEPSDAANAGGPRDAFFLSALAWYAQSGSTPSASTQASNTTPLPPLTTTGKLKYAVHRGLISPQAVFYPGLSAAAHQLYRPWGGPHKRARDKVADTFSRWAINYGGSASTELIGSFALASIFKQDPRYKRAQAHGFKPRLVHAVMHVVVTDGDNGQPQFNISRVGGQMASSGLQNLWTRKKDRTVSDTFRRFGLSLSIDALVYTLREFGPDIKKKLFKK